MGIDGRQAKAKRCLRKLGPEMLRYLENSEEVKGGITELQEPMEGPVQIGTTLQQVTQQARNEIGQKVFEIFCQEEKKKSQLGTVGCAVERFGGVGKKMSRQKSGSTNAEQKTRNILKCDRTQAQNAKQSK